MRQKIISPKFRLKFSKFNGFVKIKLFSSYLTEAFENLGIITLLAKVLKSTFRFKKFHPQGRLKELRNLAKIS